MVVLHQEGPLSDYLTGRGIDFQVLPLARLAGDVPRLPHIAFAQVLALKRIIGFLRKKQVDIVHSNDLRIHLTWPPAAKLGGRKTVFHQRMLMSSARTWRHLSRVTDRAVAISQAVYDTMPENMRLKTSVVYNPISDSRPDRALMRQQLANEIRVPAETEIVGYVGNMTLQKRPQTFVRIASALQAKRKPIAFVMFGDDRGGQRAAIADLIRREGLVGSIHVLGHRSPIEPWIAAMDVLVAPGIGDGFGRTIAEAAMIGTPVVASESGGHPEIIVDEETGLLAPPDNVPAMSAAVTRLLSDAALRERYAEHAREQAVLRFSASQHVAAIELVYESLFLREH